jgi:hypothetical protein
VTRQQLYILQWLWQSVRHDNLCDMTISGFYSVLHLLWERECIITIQHSSGIHAQVRKSSMLSQDFPSASLYTQHIMNFLRNNCIAWNMWFYFTSIWENGFLRNSNEIITAYFWAAENIFVQIWLWLLWHVAPYSLLHHYLRYARMHCFRI